MDDADMAVSPIRPPPSLRGRPAEPAPPDAALASPTFLAFLQAAAARVTAELAGGGAARGSSSVAAPAAPAWDGAASRLMESAAGSDASQASSFTAPPDPAVAVAAAPPLAAGGSTSTGEAHTAPAERPVVDMQWRNNNSSSGSGSAGAGLGGELLVVLGKPATAPLAASAGDAAEARDCPPGLATVWAWGARDTAGRLSGRAGAELLPGPPGAGGPTLVARLGYPGAGLCLARWHPSLPHVILGGAEDGRVVAWDLRQAAAAAAAPRARGGDSWGTPATLAPAALSSCLPGSGSAASGASSGPAVRGLCHPIVGLSFLPGVSSGNTTSEGHGGVLGGPGVLAIAADGSTCTWHSCDLGPAASFSTLTSPPRAGGEGPSAALLSPSCGLALAAPDASKLYVGCVNGEVATLAPSTSSAPPVVQMVLPPASGSVGVPITALVPHPPLPSVLPPSSSPPSSPPLLLVASLDALRVLDTTTPREPRPLLLGSAGTALMEAVIPSEGGEGFLDAVWLAGVPGAGEWGASSGAAETARTPPAAWLVALDTRGVLRLYRVWLPRVAPPSRGAPPPPLPPLEPPLLRLAALWQVGKGLEGSAATAQRLASAGDDAVLVGDSLGRVTLLRFAFN